MKRHFGQVIWTVAAAALSLGVLIAQDITGTWQGTLKSANGKELRLVAKISRAPAAEKLAASFYSIDQSGQPLIATSVTQKGTDLKIDIPAISGSYEGKLSADAKTITGSWMQGTPVPLNLVRVTPETAWAIPNPPPPPTLMPTNADPAFVVATIKPSEPNIQGQGYGFRGQDVTTVNTSVSWLITFAYSLHAHQMVGGPKWITSDKFDVLGRPDTAGQPSREQLKIMVRKLLADRFQLKFHIEKRELPAYTITVLKSGPKFAPSTADPNAGLGFGFGIAPGGGMTLNVRNSPFDSIANALQGNLLDKPVVNLTGLTGKYDFTMKFTPDTSQLTNIGLTPGALGTGNIDAPPDIFAAFQQQLGLKLESTKTVVDVMVIEKLEKPSDN